MTSLDLGLEGMVEDHNDAEIAYTANMAIVTVRFISSPSPDKQTKAE
jgi:hypothetical protein